MAKNVHNEHMFGHPLTLVFNYSPYSISLQVESEDLTDYSGSLPLPLALCDALRVAVQYPCLFDTNVEDPHLRATLKDMRQTMCVYKWKLSRLLQQRDVPDLDIHWRTSFCDQPHAYPSADRDISGRTQRIVSGGPARRTGYFYKC